MEEEADLAVEAALKRQALLPESERTVLNPTTPGPRLGLFYFSCMLRFGYFLLDYSVYLYFMLTLFTYAFWLVCINCLAIIFCDTLGAIFF
jgi:hypothetical protein